MNAQHAKHHSGILTISMAILLMFTLLVGGTVVGQDSNINVTPTPVSPNLLLFVENELLALYVNSSEPVDLAGFQFSVIRNGEEQRNSLLASFAVLSQIQQKAEPGMCFVYRKVDTTMVLPHLCSGTNTTFIDDVGESDVFWYDDRENRKLDIVIFYHDSSINQFCPTSMSVCSLTYGPIIPINPIFPTFTPYPLEVITTPTPPTAPNDLSEEDSLIALPPGPYPYVKVQSNQGEIKGMAWSTDSRYAISGHINGTICLWSLAKFQQTPLTCRHEAHLGSVNAVIWKPARDSLSFATVGNDGWLRTWVFNEFNITIEEGQGLQWNTGALLDISWHPQQSLLLTPSNDDKLIIWDLETGTKKSLNGSNPRAAVWQTNGVFINTIDENGIIRVVDTRNGTAYSVGEYPSGNNAGIDIAWNRGVDDMVTVGANGVVRLYTQTQPDIFCDRSGCPHIVLAQNLNDPTSLAFSYNGTLLAVGIQRGVEIFEAQSPNRLVGRLIADSIVQVTAIAWNPNNSTLIAGDNQGNVYLWSVAQTAPARLSEITQWRRSHEPSTISQFAWDANGSLLAIVDELKSMWVWDIQRQEQIGRSQGHSQIPLSVDWNLTRSLIATGGCSPNASLWDVRALPNIRLTTPLDHEVCVTAVAFNFNGNRLVTGDKNGVLRVWDWENADEEKRELLTENSTNSPLLGIPITDIEWNRTGTQFATVSETGLVVVWNWNEDAGTISVHMSRQPDPGYSITSLSWSSDSRLLATSSAAGWIAVWRIENASVYGNGFQDSYRLNGHDNNPVVSLNWSTTNDRLVSISQDGRIIVWDAALGQRMAEGQLGNEPSQVKWSPRDSRFAVVDKAGFVSIWDYTE